MLTIIDRYLLRQIVATCLVMTGIGLAILLLERVLQLFSLVANPNQAFSYVGQMLVLLLPHFSQHRAAGRVLLRRAADLPAAQARQRARRSSRRPAAASAGCSRRSWAWRSLMTRARRA